MYISNIQQFIKIASKVLHKIYIGIKVYFMQDF